MEKRNFYGLVLDIFARSPKQIDFIVDDARPNSKGFVMALLSTIVWARNKGTVITIHHLNRPEALNKKGSYRTFLLGELGCEIITYINARRDAPLGCFCEEFSLFAGWKDDLSGEFSSPPTNNLSLKFFGATDAIARDFSRHVPELTLVSFSEYFKHLPKVPAFEKASFDVARFNAEQVIPRQEKFMAYKLAQAEMFVDMMHQYGFPVWSPLQVKLRTYAATPYFLHVPMVEHDAHRSLLIVSDGKHRIKTAGNNQQLVVVSNCENTAALNPHSWDDASAMEFDPEGYQKQGRDPREKRNIPGSINKFVGIEGFYLR